MNSRLEGLHQIARPQTGLITLKCKKRSLAKHIKNASFQPPELQSLLSKMI